MHYTVPSACNGKPESVYIPITQHSLGISVFWGREETGVSLASRVAQVWDKRANDKALVRCSHSGSLGRLHRGRGRGRHQLERGEWWW